MATCLNQIRLATMFRVTLTLIDQEGVVSGHLIGRISPGGLMNIHEVTSRGLRAFVNAAFHSTSGEWYMVSIFCSVLVWGGGLQGDSS